MIKEKIKTIIEKIKQSQGVLYVLCGFPYSGKTYVSKQITSNEDIKIVSIDEIFYAKGFDWDLNKLPDSDEWKEIFQEAYELTKSLLSSGENVLFDSTNHTLKSRNDLRSVAESVNAKTHVIYIKAHEEQIWERWKENIKSKDRSIVSKELVQSTLDTFKEPQDFENVLVVNN